VSEFWVSVFFTKLAESLYWGYILVHLLALLSSVQPMLHL
jgi:hypothetical protein